MVLRSVAVTGANGMLGRHIMAALEVAGIDSIPVTRRGERPGERAWNLTQWLSHDEFSELFDGAHAIIHCAASIDTTDSLEGLFDVNTRSCAALGDWALCSGVSIVFVSSASVYSNPYAASINEDDALGQSGLGGDYAVSKIFAENIFSRMRQRGLNVAVVRPSALYGHGESHKAITSRFLELAQRGRDISISPPHDDKINFVHAMDVAEAIISIITHGSWSTYNIASDAAVTLRDLAESCIQAAGAGRVDR